MLKMTQDEFERVFAERSKMTLEEYRAHWIGLPCGCADESCEGWASVRRGPDAINEHLDFYAPDPPRRMVVGKFENLGFFEKKS